MSTQNKNACHNPDKMEKCIQKALLEVLDDSDEPEWKAIQQLRRCASREVFDRMRDMLNSPVEDERLLAVFVLCQLGTIVTRENGSTFLQFAFEDDIADCLLKALSREKLNSVVGAIAGAFGHMPPRSSVIEPLVKLAQHQDENVRFGVVLGLMHQDSESATQTLIALMKDEDADVRDWATFAIGTIREDEDTPTIREALFANIDDTDKDTRYEALDGLVLRRDKRIINRILDEFENGMLDPNTYRGDEFCDMLRELKEHVETSRLDFLAKLLAE